MTKKKNYNDWSKEELIDEVNALKKQKTYGLVWDSDKTKEVFDYYINWDGLKNKEKFPESESKFPVLKKISTKDITKHKSGDYNFLIEGDNYHALAVLNFTHDKAIDMIFIDPPYNTGNNDFKYNDSWVDSEDAYRHSKWLSFMGKRLRLAKNLLKDTGTIFITIDDNEQAQLKLLCDEIFGEKNFVGTICWRHRNSVSNDLLISQNHNFILLYARNFNTLFKNRKNFRLEREFLGFSNPDNDVNGPYKLTPVDGPGGARKGNPHYEFLGITGYWRYSKETMAELYKKGQIIKRGKTLARKYYLSDAKENGGSVTTTWWDDVGTTTEGTRTLNEIIGEGKFNNPKPVSLLKRIIELGSNENGLILDFFAGSGTTGHAVLELNKDDNGNRKFIICTNNEVDEITERALKEKGFEKGSIEYEKEGICQRVCYPRIEKVINGYSVEGKKIEGLGGNLKYFKTDFVESAPTDRNKKRIVDKSTEMICIKENAFEMVKDKGEDYKIFRNDTIKLGIIFNSDAIDDFIKEAKQIAGKFHVYVFSLDDTVPEHEFKELKGRVTLCAIPEVILHVYRRVFKDVGT